jgi:hypothetical protein
MVHAACCTGGRTLKRITLEIWDGLLHPTEIGAATRQHGVSSASGAAPNPS